MNENFTAEERIERIASHISEIIELIGEDGSREGLVKTPVRAAKALWFLTSGYRTKAEDVMQQALFAHDGSQMIVVRDIEFYSLCEHHMLPFFGKVHIAYIPDGRIVGLSKLARCVEVYAKRLQLQEQMTEQIAEAVMEHISPKGVMVLTEAEHMCMTMRGIKKPGSKTVTYAVKGVFQEDARLQEHFFRLLER